MGEVTEELIAKVEQHVASSAAAPITPQEKAVESSSEQPTPPVEKITVEVIAQQEELQEIPIEDETLTYAQKLTNEKEEEKIQAQTEVGKEAGVLTSEQLSQLAQAEALLSDKRLVQFKEFLDKGGNLVDFAKSVVGEDVNKASDEQLFDEYLASRNFSPERIEQEKEAFKSKTALEQELLVKPMRDYKKSEQEKKANDFINSVPDQRAQVSQAAQQAIQELDSLKGQYVGKKLDGVNVSETDYNEIVQDLKTGAIPAIPKVVNGQFAGYDVQRSIEMAHLWRNRNLIKKQHIEMGRTIGWNEYHKKRVKPSTQPTGAIPVIETTVSDALKELHENKGSGLLQDSIPYPAVKKN